MITKTERAELKAIVRGQFKVLRAEVTQRKAEVIADAETQINDSFSEEDKKWADAGHLAHEAVNEANRKVNDAYHDLTDGDHIEHDYVSARIPNRPQPKRAALRQEAHAKITAQVSGALLRLERQEADLLKQLAVGALETHEAREFLSDIPSVGELVPRARLAELEAQLDDRDNQLPFLGIGS